MKRGVVAAFHGRRGLEVGTSALTAVVLLAVLLPSVGAAGTVGANTLIKAPFKGAVSQPNYGTSINGCATAKAMVPKWSSTSGVLSANDSATAHPCGKGLGYIAASSYGYASGGATIGVPFRVATTGNHSVGLNFAVKMATLDKLTTTGCPAKKVNYHPTYYSSSYGACYDSIYLDIYVQAWLVDLDNSSWYSYNYTYAYLSNTTGWENYTDCYNYGSVFCYNFTGPYSYNYAYGLNDPGFAKLSFNGSTLFTLWTNGSQMNRADHFAVGFALAVTVEAYASTQSLLGPWAAAPTGSLNMATLGNGAKLTSVVIA